MDPYDVMYVDDERNAPSPLLHGRFGMRPRQPTRRTIVVPPNRAPTIIHSPGGQPAAYTSGYTIAPPGYPPFYGPYTNPVGTFAARFGLTMGELIDSAIQILAAITGLPNPPVAQGETETDTAN